MYWTLDTRSPTLEEIVLQGEHRIRDAVERVIAHHEAEIAAEQAPRWYEKVVARELEAARQKAVRAFWERQMTAHLNRGSSLAEQQLQAMTPSLLGGGNPSVRASPAQQGAASWLLGSNTV